VLELGYNYLATSLLPDLATPHLKALSHRVRESTSVSTLDGADIVYVARAHMHRIMTVNIGVGTRLPAYATSMGRAILAFQSAEVLDEVLASSSFDALTPYTVTSPGELQVKLAEIRKQGWSLVDQELELGLRSIAAPLRDRRGEVVAAVNISTRSSAGTIAATVRELREPLLNTVAEIEADLRVSAL
jgi:IclR family pca regulon transcriptional regulator